MAYVHWYKAMWLSAKAARIKVSHALPEIILIFYLKMVWYTALWNTVFKVDLSATKSSQTSLSLGWDTNFFI